MDNSQLSRNDLKTMKFKCYICMEILPHGSLEDWIESRSNSEEHDKTGTFKEKELIFLIEPIINAVKYLHLKQLIHRDIKPENILVSLDNSKQIIILKLGDFGTLKQSDYTMSLRGTFKVCSSQYMISITLIH